MTRVMGLVVFGLVVACGNKAEEPKVDPRAAEGFARTLEAVAAADPTQSAAMLAQGAFETVARSEKCLERFGTAATERARVEALLDCGLACTLDAIQKLKGKEPRTWMAALAGACEPAHFGLDQAGAAMLSPEWFLVYKVGELAAPHAKAASGPAKVKLEQAMKTFRLPLPLPAQASELYELPVAPPEVSVPVATRAYVILPARGGPALARVGAAPHATLAPGGAAMAAGEGQVLFPGNEVGRTELRAALLEAGGVDLSSEPPTPAPPSLVPQPPPTPEEQATGQYKMKKNEGDPQLARKQAIDQASQAGILGTLTKDGSFGSLSPSPGLGGEVDPGLRGDAGRPSSERPVPLLLADGGRAAAEVIELAAELDRVLLAVAAPEDTAARALTVELHSRSLPGAVSGGDALRVSVAAAGAVDRAKQQIASSSAEEVVISAEGQSLWRDAVALAAAAIARGARRIVFTTPALAEAGSLIGHGAYGQGRPSDSIITDESVKATGDLDDSVIRRFIRRHINAFEACYKTELRHDPTLVGRVDLVFTIAPDGSVKSAKATGLDKVSDCVAKSVEKIKFPAPGDGGEVNVRYPLVFKPKE